MPGMMGYLLGQRQKVDLLTKFPVEIGRKVLSYLGGRDLASCLRVSKAWRELANDPILWRNLLLREGLQKELEHPPPPLQDGESVDLEAECEEKRKYNRGARGVGRVRKLVREWDTVVFPLGSGETVGAVHRRTLAGSEKVRAAVFQRLPGPLPRPLLTPQGPPHGADEYAVFHGLPEDFGVRGWSWAPTWASFHPPPAPRTALSRPPPDGLRFGLSKTKQAVRALPSTLRNSAYRAFWYCWALALDKLNEPYNL